MCSDRPIGYPAESVDADLAITGTDVNTDRVYTMEYERRGSEPEGKARLGRLGISQRTM